MINRLDDAFRFQQQALELRGFRQQLLASNIANADTPGYKARDIDFAGALQSALTEGGSATAPAVTAPGHIDGRGGAPVAAAKVLYRTPSQPSIDGNTVEMDAERAQFADNTVRMEASLTFINGQIKSLLAAIQG